MTNAEKLIHLRKISGAGHYDCKEALRIEDDDVDLALERLKGNRPPEWQLRLGELEIRIEFLESKLENM